MYVHIYIYIYTYDNNSNNHNSSSNNNDIYNYNNNNSSLLLACPWLFPGWLLRGGLLDSLSDRSTGIILSLNIICIIY